MENKIYNCKNCKKDKTYEEMAKDKNRVDGVRKTCKECERTRINEAGKKSRQRAREVGYTYKLQKQEYINKNFEKQIKILATEIKLLKARVF